MPVPVIASSTSNAQNTGTSLVLTKPSGVVAGDLLLLLVGNAHTNAFTTPPSGWTFANAANTTGSSVSMFWKIADGGEGADETLTQSNNVASWGRYVRVTGVDQADPIDFVGVDYASTGSSHNLNAGTTTVADVLAVALVSTQQSAFYAWSGTGWTTASLDTAAPSGAVVGTVATKQVASAGSTGQPTLLLDDTYVTTAFLFGVAGGAAPPALMPRRRSRSSTATVPSSLLRGRGTRSPLNAQDYVPPVPPPHPIRRVRQAPPDPDVLRGRARRQTWAPLAVPSFPPLVPPSRRIPQNRPAAQLLRGHTRRSPAVMVLALLERELALLFDLDVLTRDLYRVIARDIATGVETVLGTVPTNGGTLAGIALADGQYAIRVEGDGRFWRGARYRREWSVTIEAGEVVEALPAVLNLASSTEDDTVYVTWQWEAGEDTATPATFGVWVGSSEPVDTSGAPDQVVAAGGPGGHLVELATSPTTFYVAVAARRGAQVGPVSTIAVAPPEEDIESPSGTSARIADGGWAGETT